MGNAAVVSNQVKNQADSEAKKLYHLLNLKGGGELVELMKKARWTKNYAELDEKIQTDVKQFLYADGEGKRLPIVELMKQRRNERSSKISLARNHKKNENELVILQSKILTDNATNGESNYLQNKPVDHKHREVCWNIDERGTVGESILHLCFLNASAIHADLAKRLLKAFPKLICDIYMGDEYYGENVLHMAIVNEDPAMVKFLLDRGVDYNGRCCGNFFCPEDQKSSRSDSEDHEWITICEKTNYSGHMYLGEYPLTFAACLGQEECVRLLIAKGANPNMQDANGNTVLHMLVIHDKKDMFDLLHGLGARLDIKNRQGLTPLTLAALLARKDMYEHILEIMREVFWIFGSVTCAGYPLHDIDSISPTGEINKDSVLNLIVYGGEDGHLDMMDGLVVNLLQEKWKTFAKFRFWRRFVAFVIYFLVFVVAFYLRPGQDRCPETTVQNGTNGVPENVTVNDPCYLLKACNTEDKARFGMEIFILLSAIVYIFLAMKEIYHQGFSLFFTTLRGAPAKALFLLSCVCVIMMLPGRAACAYQYEDCVGVLAILFTAPYFLFFCRGIRLIGPFVEMIYKMIKGDLLRFCIIYAVFIIGFSQAMYVAFIGSTCDPVNNPCVFQSPIEAMAGMFSMSVGDFEDIYATFDSSKYTALVKAVFIVYMLLVTLLLVNMLIAMMGNTYQLVNQTQKEWFRQWAKIVLVVEQSVTTGERREQQMKYSQPIGDGDNRALVIRWHQTEKEKAELRRVRELQRKRQKAKAMKDKKNMKKRNIGADFTQQDIIRGTVNL